MPTILREPLALHGGEAKAASLSPPQWPPRNEATAKRLLDLYWDGGWSFNRAGQEAALCEEYAAASDAKYAVFMANGTLGLQCALEACGIGPGDEVIVPSLTCISGALSIPRAGAISVFTDVDPDTLCLDPSRVEAAVTERTKAIMPVHLYGSMVDMDAIRNTASRHGLMIIEDCAHAHGGKWDGSGVGSLGQVGVFSFNQTKLLTCGEGGMCITNDADIAGRLHRIVHAGYAAGEHGTSCRSTPSRGLPCSHRSATEFQALILRNQLASFGDRLRAYGAAVDHLREKLEKIPGIRIQSPGMRADPQPYHKLLLIFDREPLADVPPRLLLEAVRAEGLPLKPTYGPVYQNARFNLESTDYMLPESGCPVAERVGTERSAVLDHQWLGLGPAAMNIIVDTLAKVSANADRLRRFPAKKD